MIIAIDGPAGVGKSTIAGLIASELGFYYLNSGNFYRAATLRILNRGIDFEDSQSCVNCVEEARFEVRNGRFFLDGTDVEDKLHSQTIDLKSSYLSVNPEIRKIINRCIHKLTESLDIVAEGRDMTTVVFPDADFKFFFDAKPEIRAARRFEQNPGSMSFSQVLEEIKLRDENDRNKTFGALKKGEDTVYVDTSYLTIKQVCDKVLEYVRKQSLPR